MVLVKEVSRVNEALVEKLMPEIQSMADGTSGGSAKPVMENAVLSADKIPAPKSILDPKGVVFKVNRVEPSSKPKTQTVSMPKFVADIDQPESFKATNTLSGNTWTDQRLDDSHLDD